MTYVSTPNSILTGTNIRAAHHNENFTSIQEGTTAGTFEAGLASVTASSVLSLGATIEGDRNLGDTTDGQRSIFVMSSMHEHIAPTTDGYLQGYYGVAEASDTTPMVMPRSGSILGAVVYIACVVHTTTQEASFSVYQNQTSVVSLGAYSINTASSFGTNVAFARDAYSFAPGDEISIYRTNLASGLVQASMGITLEVLFDD